MHKVFYALTTRVLRGPKFEILWPVVRLYSIFVVYGFIGPNWAAEQFGHNPHVLKNPSPIVGIRMASI